MKARPLVNKLSKANINRFIIVITSIKRSLISAPGIYASFPIIPDICGYWIGIFN